MATSGTRTFIDFIAADLQLTEKELLKVIGTWGEMSTTLGALSLKLDLLDIFQIEKLLVVQEQTGELFGDVALELGYLKEEQINKLLDIQNWARRTEILQRFYLAGTIDLEQYRKYVPQVYLI